jgi:hypothetical protein
MTVCKRALIIRPSKMHLNLKYSSHRKQYVLNIITHCTLSPARKSNLLCAILCSIVQGLFGSAVYFAISHKLHDVFKKVV